MSIGYTLYVSNESGLVECHCALLHEYEFSLNMARASAKVHRKRVRLQLFEEFERNENRSDSKIGRVVGCDPSTVKLWRARWREDSENVDDAARTGRPPKLDTADQRRVLRSLGQSENSTVRKTHKLVADKVGVDTVRRLAKRAGLHFGKPERSKISAKNKQARFRATTQENVRLVRKRLNYIFFTDEKLIHFKPSRHVKAQREPLMWTRKGQPRPARASGFQTKRFYSAVRLAPDGTVNRMHIIMSDDGQALKAPKLIRTVLKPLDKFMHQHVPGKTQCYALLDGASTHTAKVTQAWMDDNNFVCHPHPAQSPDLNPIEKCWALLVEGLASRRPQTSEGCDRAVQQEWDKIPDAAIADFINALPGVMQKVHQEPGVHVKH
jgi:transposase